MNNLRESYNHSLRNRPNKTKSKRNKKNHKRSHCPGYQIENRQRKLNTCFAFNLYWDWSLRLNSEIYRMGPEFENQIVNSFGWKKYKVVFKRDIYPQILLYKIPLNNHYDEFGRKFSRLETDDFRSVLNQNPNIPEKLNSIEQNRENWFEHKERKKNNEEKINSINEFEKKKKWLKNRCNGLINSIKNSNIAYGNFYWIKDLDFFMKFEKIKKVDSKKLQEFEKNIKKLPFFLEIEESLSSNTTQKNENIKEKIFENFYEKHELQLNKRPEIKWEILMNRMEQAGFLLSENDTDKKDFSENKIINSLKKIIEEFQLNEDNKISIIENFAVNFYKRIEIYFEILIKEEFLNIVMISIFTCCQKMIEKFKKLLKEHSDTFFLNENAQKILRGILNKIHWDDGIRKTICLYILQNRLQIRNLLHFQKFCRFFLKRANMSDLEQMKSLLTHIYENPDILTKKEYKKERKFYLDLLQLIIDNEIADKLFFLLEEKLSWFLFEKDSNCLIRFIYLNGCIQAKNTIEKIISENIIKVLKFKYSRFYILSLFREKGTAENFYLSLIEQIMQINRYIFY